jgi:phosphoribosylglycinamide formyltransferase-1
VPPIARIAVFASGGGSNLQALMDRCQDPGAPARVVLVVGSRSGIGALERAARAGIPNAVLDPRTLGEAAGATTLELLEANGIDLIVLAGYLSLVPQAVVERFRGRMINIHPALLPSFGGHGMYGMRVHRAVIESGARVSGATVHLVDDRYDEGRILAQWPVPVLPGDTAESLAARVLTVEHRLLPAAVFALCGQASASPVGSSFALAAAGPPSDAEIGALIDTTLPAGISPGRD